MDGDSGLDISNATPRVNYAQLRNYASGSQQKVKLVGEVLGLDGDCARVKAADGGTVKVQLTNGPSFDSPFYEFEGVVQTPEQIREISRSSFGGTFNLQNYNQLCEIVHSTHAPLFKS